MRQQQRNKKTAAEPPTVSPVMTVQQAAEKWGLSRRRVSRLCQDGRVPGAVKLSERYWLMPSDTPKPSDGRQSYHKAQTKCLEEEANDLG